MEKLPQLPTEVWVNIFSYLSTEDKNRVRTCCRSLRRLIDHPALWKGSTLVLSDLRRYTYGFWDTLHRRRLTRVAVRHLRRKEWRRLVTFLPSLTAIVFVDGGRVYKEKYLVSLIHFPELRDLGVRNATWEERMLGPRLTEALRERLTHLSVCNVRLPSAMELVEAVSQLVNLRYLLFHQQGESLGVNTDRPVPRLVFHNMMLRLKKLQHLSWGMRGEPRDPLAEDYFSPADPDQPGEFRYGGPMLTKLELVDYSERILPENALRSLTSLQSLTVRYNSVHPGIRCRLRSWLAPLHQLDTLSIIGGHPLSIYATSIPSTITRLTLRVAITLKDMDTLAPKVPALRHLDVEQNRSSGSLCKRIPMLFPQLRTLHIRFVCRNPEKDLLCLHKLKHLERLELLVDRLFMKGQMWPTPFVQGLINQLRQLSENRIYIVTKTEKNLLRECDCEYEGD